jgi:hypothetical protein
MTDSAGQFVEPPRTQDCSKHAGGWGRGMDDFEYIWYGNKSKDDYPEDACTPYYHKSAKIDDFQITNDLEVTGDITAGEVTAGGKTLSSRKDFDIPHPTKDGWRLRHVCLEGPEAGVYYRGRLTNDTMINLPEYWDGLVDPATITVSLTQIGSSQDLIVDAIQWGKRIKVRSGTAANIDCYFLVHAERKDGERLIVEYEGTSIDDYPGDNSQYTHNK